MLWFLDWSKRSKKRPLCVFNTTLNNKTQASWCDMTLTQMDPTQILDADYMARPQSVRLAQRCKNKR